MRNSIIGRMKCGHVVAVDADDTPTNRESFVELGYSVEVHEHGAACELMSGDLDDHKRRCKQETTATPGELITKARKWAGDNSGWPATMLRALAAALEQSDRERDQLRTELAIRQTQLERSEAALLALRDWAKVAGPVVEAVSSLRECSCKHAMSCQHLTAVLKMPIPKGTP